MAKSFKNLTKAELKVMLWLSKSRLTDYETVSLYNLVVGLDEKVTLLQEELEASQQAYEELKEEINDE